MSPLLNADLFKWGSTQVEEYDEGFKYLMHEECMQRTQETYQHVDCILFYITSEIAYKSNLYIELGFFPHNHTSCSFLHTWGNGFRV